MALPEGVNKRYASIAGGLLVVLWVWVAFDRPYSFPKHAAWNQYANAPQTSGAVPDVFHNPEVNSDTIRNICAGTEWNSTLVMQCDNGEGNIGNVRHTILNCVRRAIDIGANMMLPRILSPDGEHEAGWTLLYWSTHPFDFMFDKDHFVNSLRQSCPQMQIYENKKKVPFPNNYVHPPVITVVPEHIGMRDGESWRTAFYRLVQALIRPDEDTLPIIVEMARPEPVYDIFNDGAAFVKEFGRILQFRPDVRDMANKSLKKLSTLYNFAPGSMPDELLPFFGAHLLTEEEKFGCRDNWPCIDRDFGLYKEESEGYLSHASNSNTSVIYLSSHRPDEIDRFRKDAEARGLKVHTKFDLLEGDDKANLNKLGKDQQQLIDYLILLKASSFGGIGHSAFSWNVALKRHTMAGPGEFTIGSHIFEDKLSKLWGKLDAGRTLYHHMWP